MSGLRKTERDDFRQRSTDQLFLCGLRDWLLHSDLPMTLVGSTCGGIIIFKNLREGGKIHPVLEAQYSHSRPGLSSSNAMIESGWYRPKWEIRVRPVIRRLKHSVMELILAEGLPRVREWLLSRKGLAGREAYDRMTLLFDEVAGTMSYEQYSHA